MNNQVFLQTNQGRSCQSQSGCSYPFHVLVVVLWPSCMSSLIKLSQMSCPLWFSLRTVYFGIWWLLQTSCAGEWKSSEPNRHVAKFRSWPLKWLFLWDSTRVMSDIRSCNSDHQAAGEQILHFSSLKTGGVSLGDLQPTSNCLLA